MRTRRRLFRIWHRRIGLISSVFLLWIALSGLLLNHTESLGLNGPTRLGYLAQWMGVSVRCDAASWPVSAGVLVACENGLYLGERRISELATLQAALDLSPWLLAFGDGGVWVFEQNGQLVDVLPLPRSGPVDGVLRSPAGVVVIAGAQAWMIDADTLEWVDYAGPTRDLPAPSPRMLDDQTLSGFATRASGEALNWTKLLQEMHSGRILTHVGPVLLDLAGIALILLALLGIVIDVRRTHPGGAKH